jgi:hypothetical protein
MTFGSAVEALQPRRVDEVHLRREVSPLHRLTPVRAQPEARFGFLARIPGDGDDLGCRGEILDIE